MTKRAIAAIELPDVEPGFAATKEPIFEWVDPCDLLVDERYQRDLTPQGYALIRRIVANWDWRRFKPPTAVLTDDGLELLDGQHTALAAATHPGISKIPVAIVIAEEIEERARAFVGINRDRLVVTPVQMHHAEIAAGDRDAKEISLICGETGVTVLRGSPGQGCFKPADTLAVAAIGMLVRNAGGFLSRQVLRTLVEAECTPITASQIKAVTLLLDDEEFSALDPAGLATTIREMSVGGQAEREAKAFAETHCVPRWKALANVWFKSARKRRTVPTAVPPLVHTRVAREPRPAKGSWQPGRFSRRCRACDQLFTGAQSAFSCENCAYSEERAAS